MKTFQTMSDQIRRRMIRTDDEAEAFDARAEALTLEAWTDPEMLVDVAVRCGEDARQDKQAAALLVGKILQAAMQYANAWRRDASPQNDAQRVAALAHILACATQLDGDEYFEAELRAMVEEKMLWDWHYAQEEDDEHERRET